MGSDVVGVDGGDDQAGVCDLGCIAAVPAHNADDGRADFKGKLKGFDKVWADIFLKVAAAHAEHHDQVVGPQSADFEPLQEDAGPAFVVGSGREFRDIVGRGVGFNADNLAKVVHGMGGIGCAAAHAKNEEAALAMAGLVNQRDHAFCDVRVDLVDDLPGFIQKLL